MKRPQPPNWHALVLDDEALARLRLKQLLVESAPALGCVGVQEAASAAQALALLRQAPAQHWLVFADIQLPGMDGLQFAQALGQQARAAGQWMQLVFVSAHGQHALQAFELAALDFLSKPVRRDRLLQAMDKALRQQAGSLLDPPPRAAPTVLMVEAHGQRVALPLCEVVYVQAECKYLTLHSATRSWLMQASLQQLEQTYAPQLLRIHRNTLVQRAQLLGLSRRTGLGRVAVGWQVQLRALDLALPVSRRQLSAVQAALRTD
jgi:two-component system response regulator AlgR